MREAPERTGAAWTWALREGSFEQCFAALDEVVAHLEAGNLPLADTVAFFELGVRLAERCEAFLADAELRISEIGGDPEADEPAGDDPFRDPPNGAPPLRLIDFDDIPF